MINITLLIASFLLILTLNKDNKRRLISAIKKERLPFINPKTHFKKIAHNEHDLIDQMIKYLNTYHQLIIEHAVIDPGLYPVFHCIGGFNHQSTKHSAQCLSMTLGSAINYNQWLKITFFITASPA